MADETYACGTAPGVLFPTREALKAHYSSEWHRYNLKRKEARLPPVVEAEFERRRDEALAAANDVKERKQNHLKESKLRKKKKEEAKKRKRQQHGRSAGASSDPPAAPQPALRTISELFTSLQLTALQDKAGADGSGAGADASGIVAFEDVDEEDESAADWGALQQLYEAEAAKIDITHSIFDGRVSADVFENLAYMQRRYGFFVPDAEYICDLPGLLTHVAAKVHLGCVCLQCGRAFKTAVAVQQHMVAACHCKLAYEDEEALDELAVFYDFSSSHDYVSTSCGGSLMGGGSLAGSIAGSVGGSVAGSVAGSLAGSVSGSVAGSVVGEDLTPADWQILDEEEGSDAAAAAAAADEGAGKAAAAAPTMADAAAAGEHAGEHEPVEEGGQEEVEEEQAAPVTALDPEAAEAERRAALLKKAYKAGRRIHLDDEDRQLVLLDGRRLIHRELNKYAKQRYRPNDEHDSARAHERRESRQRLMLTYKGLGVATSSALSTGVARSLYPGQLPKKWRQQMQRDTRHFDKRNQRVRDKGVAGWKGNNLALKPNDSGHLS